MKRLLIEKLGGYATIEDAINAIETKKDKHTILTKAVSQLFNTVGENDILTYKNGQWYNEGRALTEEEVHQIKSEAQTFKKFRLYEILNAEVKYHAARKMYYQSQTVDDLMAGKMIEYVWDIVKTKLNKLH